MNQPVASQPFEIYGFKIMVLQTSINKRVGQPPTTGDTDA